MAAPIVADYLLGRLRELEQGGTGRRAMHLAGALREGGHLKRAVVWPTLE